MARIKIVGTVVSYKIDEQGQVSVGFSDNSPTEYVKTFVRNASNGFDPKSMRQKVSARTTPCPANVHYDFGEFQAKLEADVAKVVHHGSVVEAEMEVFPVKKPIFANYRWSTLNEIRYEIISVRPYSAGVDVPAAMATSNSSGVDSGQKRGGK